MQKNFSKQSQSPPGFTLVEVMVAMVIAMIVLGGVYRTLVDEDVNHERSEMILDMQNNARVALERITRDVRRTGSLGCGGLMASSTLRKSVNTPTDFITRYTIAANPPAAGLAWDGTQSILKTVEDLSAMTNVNYLSEVMGFGGNALADHPLYKEGSDAITLVYLSDERVVAGAMGSGSSSFNITSPGFAQDDILYVTDCENFSLFQKTNGATPGAGPYPVKHESTGLNFFSNLGKEYGKESAARVFKLNTTTYFLYKAKNTLCDNAIGAPLASNIEDLQFEFLADENGNGLLDDESWRNDLAAYTSARAVRAVRIWVLAMSAPDYTYTDENTYDYPNSPYCSDAWLATPGASCRGGGSPAALAPLASPPDGEHRHRYLASTVVYLRNAGLK